MKTIKLLALTLISALTLNSCLVDDEDSIAEVTGETPVIAGFGEVAKSHVFTPANVDVVTTEVFIERVGGSDMVLNRTEFTYSVDTTNPAVTILNSSNTLTIEQGTYLSNEGFRYAVDPTAITAGETITLTVTLTPTSGGVQTASYSPMVITIQKCDPPLMGDYVAANLNFGGGAGEDVIVSPLGCNDQYQANNIPIFGGVYPFEFSHNPADDTIIVLGSEFIETNFGGTVSGSGTVLPNGTIQFVDFVVTAGGLSDHEFDLVPN